MKKVIALGIVASAFLQGCGAATNTQGRSDLSIVGGTDAETGDEVLKHTVALVDRDFQTFCTGTLITPVHILTAAHCVADSVDVIYAVFTSKVDGESVRVRDMRFVSKAVYHAGYAKDLENPEVNQQIITGERQGNDIALLQMVKPAPSAYTPVYTIGNNEVPVGAKLKLAGFGLTKMDPITAFRLRFPNFDPSKPQQTAVASVAISDDSEVPAISTDPEQPTQEDIEALRRAHAAYVPDAGKLRATETMLAKKSKGNEFINVPVEKDVGAVCNGDSGGPAYAQVTDPNTHKVILILAGVASRGNCKDYSVHTDVHSYTEWIDTATEAVVTDDAGVAAPSTATKVWAVK